MNRLCSCFAAAAYFLFGGIAFADTFGDGSDAFDIEFVTIGNPGNPGDPNTVYHRGSVPATVRIGKHEVSEEAVAKANTLGGLNISTETLGPNKPATSVSWNEAARFVNWLNTSEGYPPAYKFAVQPGQPGYDANANIDVWQSIDPGYNRFNVYRNSLAQFFLPSIDESYKAAYFDPSKNLYYNHATGSSQNPTSTTGGTLAGTAVFGLGYLYPNAVPANVDFAGGLSPYGTMAQAGNALEWSESAYDNGNDDVNEYRHRRGGSWYSLVFELLKTNDSGSPPTLEFYNIGFRVASNVVPEPSGMVFATAASICALFVWRYRC
jgi:formylglycine-generating enzyme